MVGLKKDIATLIQDERLGDRSFSLFTLAKSHIIQLLNQNKVEKTNICTKSFVTACKYILK